MRREKIGHVWLNNNNTREVPQNWRFNWINRRGGRTIKSPQLKSIEMGSFIKSAAVLWLNFYYWPLATKRRRGQQQHQQQQQWGHKYLCAFLRLIKMQLSSLGASFESDWQWHVARLSTSSNRNLSQSSPDLWATPIWHGVAVVIVLVNY